MSADLKEKLAGRTVVASVSGGKDSAALCLWLQEQGIEHRRVFADTGWEHELTYEYLRGPLTAKLGPIEEVGFPGGMKALVGKKSMFPSRVARFCTQELKVRPLVAYHRALQNLVETVSAVGIRAQESTARAAMTEWEWNDDFDCDVWRPLINWTEDEVIAIHKRHGLAPNPLYLKGASRVGCWPCVFARKAEVRLVAEIDPGRIEEIRTMEAEVGEGQLSRAAAAGVEREKATSTFFYGRAENGAKRQLTIDEVVDWSKQERGQYLLLDDAPAGCVRWGLCESSGGAR